MPKFLDRNYFDGDLERAQGLLHELGHAYSLMSLQGSGGSQFKFFDNLPFDINGAQKFNQNLVVANCSK